MKPTPLRAVLAGCGRMGAQQARVLARHPDFRLLAVQDIVPEAAQTLAGELGVRAYAKVEQMLEQETPDTISVTTPNSSHAAVTLLAVEGGVRGIFCEKPMAVHLEDARRMHEACTAKGVVLMINHQRRTGPDLAEARRLIESGQLGEVRLMRGDCAGDLLSDGTHLIDSLLFLAGESPVRSAWGMVFRAEWKPQVSAGEGSGYDAEHGVRFGHPVEEGAAGILLLENQIRLEICCGELHDRRRRYHDLEVIGTGGRLWRPGDGDGENLFIEDGCAGTHVAGILNGQYQCIPSADGPGNWRLVKLERNEEHDLFELNYAAFASLVREGGGDHPLTSSHALSVHEALTAIYESARLRSMVRWPVLQRRFPLELMLDPD